MRTIIPLDRNSRELDARPRGRESHSRLRHFPAVHQRYVLRCYPSQRERPLLA